MGALTALAGYLIGGVVFAILAGAVTAAFLLVPQMAPIDLVMRMHRARPLHPQSVPVLYQHLAELSRRAELEHMPHLYLIPSPVCNAFAVGNSKRAAIGVSQGLLQQLPEAEVVGVLAHEVSHLRHDDLRLMHLAAIFGRMSSLAANIVVILTLINLPLLLVGQATVPWAVVLLLLGLPSAQVLLQLAFSRSREFAADLSAAELMGTPAPLAHALARLEHLQTRAFWPIRPSTDSPQDAWLRTHPPSAERIERLRALASSGIWQAARPLDANWDEHLPSRQSLRPSSRIRTIIWR